MILCTISSGHVHWSDPPEGPGNGSRPLGGLILEPIAFLDFISNDAITRLVLVQADGLMRPPDTAPQESCVGCVVARRRMSKPTLGGGRIGRATIVGFIALQHLLLRADASNWAQTTGPQQQNNVIPRIPNPDVLGSQSGDYPGKNDHWSRRQGQALVIVPANTSAGRVASAFILGGDSYVRDSDFTELSGQFMNDVWYTEGVQWFTGWEAEKKVGLSSIVDRARTDNCQKHIHRA